MLPSIKVVNVTKKYGNKLALSDATFEAKGGELVGVIGPNGAGKTTFIQIAVRAIRATAGKVEMVVEVPHKLAWVSQNNAIDWYLSVYENVLLGARLGGKSFNKAEILCLYYIDLLHLSEYKHQQPDTLSGGQLRRLEIARALAQEPDIMILDEPTTGLDPIAARKVLQELKLQTQQGKLVILSCHDMHLLQDYVDRILLFNKGRIVKDINITSITKNLQGYYLQCMEEQRKGEKE